MKHYAVATVLVALILGILSIRGIVDYDKVAKKDTRVSSTSLPIEGEKASGNVVIKPFKLN